MDPQTIQLSPEQVTQLADAIARRIVELQAPNYRPELNVAESMALTGHRSTSAFYSWCKRAHVRSVSQGRYRRSAIMRGLGG